MARWQKTIGARIKYGILVVTILLVFAGYWVHKHPFFSCNRVDTVLDHDDAGRSVIYTRNLCDGIASADVESLDLVLPSGERNTILEFDFADHAKKKEDFERINAVGAHDPKATWVDSKTLKIEIGAVGNIKKKITSFEGINIIFDIPTIITDE